MPTKVVGRRVAAHLIDGLVYSVIGAVAWFALTDKVPGRCISGGVNIGGSCHGFTNGHGGQRVAWFAILVIAWVAIYMVLPGLRGTSPGHALLRLRIVDAEGRPPGLGRGIVRGLLWIVDGFPYIIPDLVAFITALTSARNQRVGDMVASTFVVDAAAAAQPVPQAAAAPGVPAPPGGPAPQAPPTQPAGWYSDPHGQARLRWWDGAAWTEQTSA